MNEELNIYVVVRYFVEKSGMLFFYTKEDVKVAYDRINTIIDCEKKYNGKEVSKQIQQLKLYYNYFINNYDEYKYHGLNRQLFDNIVKIDGNIQFCGSEYSLNNYIINLKKNLQNANSSLFFFQRRYAVREGIRKFDEIIEGIKKYKKHYNITISFNSIDKVIDFLQIDTLSDNDILKFLNVASSNDEFDTEEYIGCLSIEDRITAAYNRMINIEYQKMVNDPHLNDEKLINESNKFACIKDIITNFYDLDDKLEDKTLYEMYHAPLSVDSEYYEALRYFKLKPDATKDEIIDSIEKTIDNIVSTEIVNFASMNGTYDSKKNDDNVLNNINHYKEILYKYYGVEEEKEQEKFNQDENANNNFTYNGVSSDPIGSTDYSLIYANLFKDLDYSDAKKMYFSLMNNLLNSNSKENNIKIAVLEKFWQSFESDAKKKEFFPYSKPKK